MTLITLIKERRSPQRAQRAGESPRSEGLRQKHTAEGGCATRFWKSHGIWMTITEKGAKGRDGIKSGEGKHLPRLWPARGISGALQKNHPQRQPSTKFTRKSSRAASTIGMARCSRLLPGVTLGRSHLPHSNSIQNREHPAPESSITPLVYGL